MTNSVTLELPLPTYKKLQELADAEQLQPVDIIIRLIEAIEPRSEHESEEDPVFELIGAYHSQQPLIDGIPVSENPDLYLTAAAMAERATNLSIREITPGRYDPDPTKQPSVSSPTTLEDDSDEAEA